MVESNGDKSDQKQTSAASIAGKEILPRGGAFYVSMHIYIQGVPRKKDTILIVNNCFRFQGTNFYFEAFEKGGFIFYISCMV